MCMFETRSKRESFPSGWKHKNTYKIIPVMMLSVARHRSTVRTSLSSLIRDVKTLLDLK